MLEFQKIVCSWNPISNFSRIAQGDCLCKVNKNICCKSTFLSSWRAASHLVSSLTRSLMCEQHCARTCGKDSAFSFGSQSCALGLLRSVAGSLTGWVYYCPSFLLGPLLLSQVFPLSSQPLGTSSWKGTAEGKQINVENDPRCHHPRQYYPKTGQQC